MCITERGTYGRTAKSGCVQYRHACLQAPKCSMPTGMYGRNLSPYKWYNFGYIHCHSHHISCMWLSTTSSVSLNTLHSSPQVIPEEVRKLLEGAANDSRFVAAVPALLHLTPCWSTAHTREYHMEQSASTHQVCADNSVKSKKNKFVNFHISVPYHEPNILMGMS